MDALLKSAIALRDAEQGLDGAEWNSGADELRRKKLELLIVPARCRLCGNTLNISKEELSQATVCVKCGGRKHQRRLEAEDDARVKQQRRREALLRIAGIHPKQGAVLVADEKRLCSVEACNATLVKWNKTGLCTSHSKYGSARPSGGAAASSSSAASADDALKRFRIVAKALGADPEKLLRDFADGWLETLRSRVNLE